VVSLLRCPILCIPFPEWEKGEICAGKGTLIKRG